MLQVYTPQLEDLWFRQSMMSDEETERYMANVIVKAEYRGNGFGNQGLKLLCCFAKENGVTILYDDIAIDNSPIALFLKNGFEEEYRTEEIIMLRKNL